MLKQLKMSNIKEIDDVKIINILANDVKFINNWRLFCKSLQFNQRFMYDLERMDNSKCAITDIIINIMEHWKSFSPKNFSAETLSEKLLDMQCTSSAETVQYLCGLGEGIQAKSELIWFNVREPTIFYAGREEEMKVIENVWNTCLEKKSMRFVAITGLGGIGKSELVANYAKTFHESVNGHCIWIDAESNQTVLQNIQNVATAELQISITDELRNEKHLETLVSEIYTKISDKKCLFVFDNLDSYEEPAIELLKNLSKQKKPSDLKPLVLTTSRFRPAIKHFGNRCTQLELDVLKGDVAMQFFRKYLNLKLADDNTIEVIGRLCKRLNCYPLGMQQAAAYINENLRHDIDRNNSDVEKEIEEYLSKIEMHTKVVLDHKFPDDSCTTYLTWGVSFDKISKTSEGGIEAIKLMNIISFLSPDNISIAFLTKIFERMQNIDMNEPALKLLDDHSIVKLKPKSLSVHRLVQEVARINLKAEELIDTLSGLLKIMEGMLKTINEIPSDQMVHVQRIWKHTTENTEVIKKWEKFPARIAQKLLDTGKYKEACDFSCNALSTLESTLGENNRWTLVMMYRKGVALRHLGEFLESLEVLTEVYKKQTQAFEEMDHHCLRTANQIGLVHWRLQNCELALKWYHIALEMREKFYGKRHSSIPTLLNNIALVLDKQGKYSEASEMYQQILEVEERVKGKEHLSTLITKQNLAVVRCNQGQYNEALTMLEKVLKIREEALEVDHPLTLDTKATIADTYECLGRLEEALPLWKEVSEKRMKILGPKHPNTIASNKKLESFRKSSQQRFNNIRQTIFNYFYDFCNFLNNHNLTSIFGHYLIVKICMVTIFTTIVYYYVSISFNMSSMQ